LRYSDGPVVVAIFDELPTTSLLDERRRIDPNRYPNFAAFAEHATRYRNASTVAAATARARPAPATA
jgi:hypothetical protein